MNGKQEQKYKSSLISYSEYDATVATWQNFWLIFDNFRMGSIWPIKIQGVLEAESWNLNGFSF